MLYLLRYLKGFLKITVSGEHFERILNIAAINRITIWKTRLCKNGLVTYISIDDFKKLRVFLRHSKCKIHILKKYGIPFKIDKSKSRIGIYIGIILLISTIIFLQNKIWVIEVTGNKNINYEEIIRCCEKIGITEGIDRKKINSKRDRERLMLICDGLAWASLNIEGSVLNVNVTEVEQINTDNFPTNLKADFDGIIKRIDVTSGNCIVKIDDAVKKGDILVSGIIDNKNETVFTKSQGVVFAETRRDFSLTEAFVSEKNLVTGERKEKNVLEILGLKLPLYLGNERRAYISSTKITNLKLFDKKIPIKLYKKEFDFTKKVKTHRSEKELMEILEKKLLLEIKNLKPESYEILNKEFLTDKNGVTLNVQIKAYENIAKSEVILIGQSLE